MKVTYYNRDQRPGNFSIEELFASIRSGIGNRIESSDYYVQPNKSRLKAILEAGKFQGDVNHITGDVNYLSYGLDKQKTILTVHDVGHFENTLKGWKRSVYKYLWLSGPFSNVNHITTISDFTKSRIIHHFGVNPDKIKVISNPFPKHFTFHNYQFNSEKPRILQIGPGRNKNIYRLVEAVKGISCELVLIRKPDQEIEQHLKNNAIDFTWLSNLSYQQVADEYAKCDLLFFASEYEGFGMPIIEAQVTGRPVLTGNITAMPEVAGNAACIVDPFDVSSIRKGILQIIESGEYRSELVANGLENIKRFELDNISNQYLDMYRKIATR